MKESYTDIQIDFVMNEKANGKTFNEIKDAFNKKFRKDLTYSKIRKIYRTHVDKYDFTEYIDPSEIKTEKAKEKHLKIYYDYVKKYNKRPSQNQLKAKGANEVFIKKHYGNMLKLGEAVEEVYPDVFEAVLDDHLLKKKRVEKIHTKIKGSKRFLITSVVNDKPLFKKAFQAMQTWKEEENGELIFMPCSDPASVGTTTQWQLPTELAKEHIVLNDLALNENLTLCSIKLTAKQINPLSGLDRLVREKGSLILAAPKQHLKHLPDYLQEGNTRAICTTGAITLPDYNTSRYLSERTGYLAEYDHCLGAIIVELDRNGIFHFRQVQFEPKTGAFIDLDYKYHANGSVTENRVSLIRCGDYHAGETDPIMKKQLEEISYLYEPQYLVIEDFNNGHSISPWNRRRIVKKSQKFKEGMTSLSIEFDVMTSEAKFLDSLNFESIVFIPDNHSLFLERYLDYCEFKDDYENLELALQLALELQRGENVTEAGLRLKGFKSSKFRFLLKDESFAPNGIENSIHGFKIKGGKTVAPANYDRAYGAVNLGHTHSALMYRNVVRCGTMTYLTSDKIDYIEGASDWTHTMIFEHENGSRQLVNIIKGKHRL
jgi:hypothetical protein